GVFDGRGLGYFLVQAATMLILVLAANTAYADFPRLASILARDGYLPRQLMNQGDRLAFSNGILWLSVCAGVLLVIHAGDTHSLIPLYMIGVFLSFTVSQAGMVRHWQRLKSRGWTTNAIVNGAGALVTGVVLIVVAVTKGQEGAWIVLVLIPVYVLFFRMVHHHYATVAAQLALTAGREGASERRGNVVLVPISGVHQAVLQALDYAKTLSPEIRAVCVDLDAASTKRIETDWPRWNKDVPLVVLDSPYRSLMEPLLEYIGCVERQRPDSFVTIVVPEFIPARWWHHLFHNQSALLMKGELLFRPNVVVTSVPFHLTR
ncbi:MAG: amino acid permease, partial [Vicinamibacterales bacterium]